MATPEIDMNRLEKATAAHPRLTGWEQQKKLESGLAGILEFEQLLEPEAESATRIGA